MARFADKHYRISQVQRIDTAMAIPITYNVRNLIVRKTTTIMTALGSALRSRFCSPFSLSSKDSGPRSKQPPTRTTFSSRAKARHRNLLAAFLVQFFRT